MNGRLAIRVKLTQGTGMGTCRWNINLFLFLFLFRPIRWSFDLQVFFNFLILHENLIEFVVLSSFTCSIIYYVVNNLIFDFIGAFQFFNDRNIKVGDTTNEKQQLPGYQTRLRKFMFIIIFVLF